MMEKKHILSMVDHTNLKVDASWDDIKKLCQEGMEHQVASVCIPPSFVADARAFVGDKLKICTVIAFPNGYHTTKVKIFETQDALESGADEIDMVIPQRWVKDQQFSLIKEEINEIKDICGGKVLKVIVETCMLVEVEKIKLCEVVSESKADFIKTSTGFSKTGATLEDIILMKKYCIPELGIKAAGGISSFEDAKAFLEAGATRLGTSRLIGTGKAVY